MKKMNRFGYIHVLLFAGIIPGLYAEAAQAQVADGAKLALASPQSTHAFPRRHHQTLILGRVYYETEEGRSWLPASASLSWCAHERHPHERLVTMADGRTVRLLVSRHGDDYSIRLEATPSDGIVRWGLSIDAAQDEYFTGSMERVVDGPQEASWAPGIEQAMNLRGQMVEMVVKSTTSLYSPFYLSSHGYAVFVRGNWPGRFDFGASDPERVGIDFEGPSLELKIYASGDPAEMVRAHALDAGPPVLPPAWAFSPWRWRDEHTQRTAYYDGTKVTGPFNSEAMEDVLMMGAYGIPCGVYWIDRPYGLGRMGYDDFEIDPARFPNFAKMVNWLGTENKRTVMWIAPFLQGKMAEEGLLNGYTLIGQDPQASNYPLVDFSNPAAVAHWQSGVAKLLNLGVAGFKLDRSEEDLPPDESVRIFDGRTIRESRNAYPAMYIQAAYQVAEAYRKDDFALMARAGYTGSTHYGVFWGGDIGGTQEGLRASIIAVQRAAIMGYPSWGSDTCGYNEQLLEQEVCGRWLAFSSLTPIMEVGPTKNHGFWDLPREPAYDTELIAIWRLYARLHERLRDYTHTFARIAAQTGMPIVRPLFLSDPWSASAWSNWWTYQYGSDLVVSPIWQKGQLEQQVYLPSGAWWRNAWLPNEVHWGGKTVTVHAAAHQIPLFVKVGSPLELGDLNQEYVESQAIAQQRPDLKTLDAQLTAWFDSSQ